MEYFVTRLYAEGIRLGKEARAAGRTRGRLGFEWNTHRQRQILVATLFGNSRWLLPSLMDPTVAGMVGDSWILTGQEIIRAEFDFKAAQPKGPDRIFGQTWVIEPEGAAALNAAREEQERIRRELNEARAEANRLRFGDAGQVGLDEFLKRNPHLPREIPR